MSFFDRWVIKPVSYAAVCIAHAMVDLGVIVVEFSVEAAHVARVTFQIASITAYDTWHGGPFSVTNLRLGFIDPSPALAPTPLPPPAFDAVSTFVIPPQTYWQRYARVYVLVGK